MLLYRFVRQHHFCSFPFRFPALSVLLSHTHLHASASSFAASRKRTSAGGEVENIWEVCHGRNDVRYHISRKHPAVEALLAGDPEIGKAVESLLVLIENTVPVQRIWLDAAEGRDAPRRIDDATPSDVMQEILLTVYKNRIRHGNCTPQEVRRQLLLAEPFSEFPELVESLPDMI